MMSNALTSALQLAQYLTAILSAGMYLVSIVRIYVERSRARIQSVINMQTSWEVDLQQSLYNKKHTV